MSESRPLFVRLVDAVKNHVEPDSLYFEALQKVHSSLPAELRAGLKNETDLALALRDVAFPDSAEGLTPLGEKLAVATVHIVRSHTFSTAYPPKPAAYAEWTSTFNSVDGVDPYLVWLLMTADGKATGFRWMSGDGHLSLTAASAATGALVATAEVADTPAVRAKELSLFSLPQETKSTGFKERLALREEVSLAAISALPTTKPYADPADEAAVQLLLDVAAMELHEQALQAFRFDSDVFKAVQAIRDDPAALKLFEESVGASSSSSSSDELRPYADPAAEPVVQLLLDVAALEQYRQEMEVYDETSILIDAWNMAIQDDKFVEQLRTVQKEMGTQAPEPLTFEENQEQVKRKILRILEGGEQGYDKDEVEERTSAALNWLGDESPAYRAQQDTVLDEIIKLLPKETSGTAKDRLPSAPVRRAGSASAGLATVAPAAVRFSAGTKSSGWGAERQLIASRVVDEPNNPIVQRVFISAFVEYTFPGVRVEFQNNGRWLVVHGVSPETVRSAIDANVEAILGRGIKMPELTIR